MDAIPKTLKWPPRLWRQEGRRNYFTSSSTGTRWNPVTGLMNSTRDFISEAPLPALHSAAHLYSDALMMIQWRLGPATSRRRESLLSDIN